MEEHNHSKSRFDPSSTANQRVFLRGTGYAVLAIKHTMTKTDFACTYGVSWCAPSDRFDKERGKKIALRRMESYTDNLVSFPLKLKPMGTFRPPPHQQQSLDTKNVLDVLGEACKSGPSWAKSALKRGDVRLSMSGKARRLREYEP